MTPSDHDLLRQYAHAGSQPAFAELVRRHIDLVYSAARRQVRSGALAEEVAQSVFLDLSRRAAEIKPATPLVAWLHVVTRRTAIDVIRHESRRQAREQAALEIASDARDEIDAMKTTPSVWTELEPLLDEALGALDEPDRSAVLLRYFENKNLREVGHALGLSDDAAQKRVRRALERLRQILSKRAIVASAASLATEISLHAVQPAPTGLAATLSSTITLPGVVTVKAAALNSFKTLAMKTTHKILIATVAAAAITAGLYQALILHRQAGEIAQLKNLSTSWQQEIQRLGQQRSVAARQVAQINANQPVASSSDDSALDSRMRALVENVNRMKKYLDQNPGEQIPELRFLRDLDWFEVAQKYPDLGTVSDYRATLAYLRIMAKHKFLPLMQTALDKYLKASQGFLPTDVMQLASYFNPPIENALLQRYEMLSSGPASALSKDSAILREKASLAIDPLHDNLGGLTGYGDTVWGVPQGAVSPGATSESIALQKSVDQAVQAFSAAHRGIEPKPDEMEKLIPYFQDREVGMKFVQGFKEAIRHILPADLNQARNEAAEAFRITHHGAEPTDQIELASYFQKPEDGARYIEFVSKTSRSK